MYHIKLNNKLDMPMEGYGVYQITEQEECEKAVLNALDAGYRSIDTAAAYFNEEAVGAAIKKSGIPRKDLFITTKLWSQDAGYENAKKAFQTSLNKLGVDDIDACEIIGLNQESPINTGFERFSPFSLTRKQEKFHKRRRQYAQSRNLSAKRRAASTGGVFSCRIIQTDISIRWRNQLSAPMDLRRVPVRDQAYVSMDRAA